MRRRPRLLFAAIVLGYLLYAAAGIWTGSVVFEGERFFLLDDDPLISMRYARHLAAGHGFAWNVGEPPVEGFTNPLWVVVMAGVHLLPVSLALRGLVVQLLALALLTGNLFLVRRLAARAGGGDAAALAAVFLTASSYGLAYWGLTGWEVCLVAPLFVAAVLAAADATLARRFPAAAYALLSVATLVRLDAAVAFVAIAAISLWHEHSSRVRHAVAAAGILGAALGAQTALRLWYFGDWLPNTYYLKMTGYPSVWRLVWGARYLAGTVLRQRALLHLLALAVVLRRRSPVVQLIAATVAAQYAYSAYAGVVDTRFVTTVAPLFFVLVAVGLEALVRQASARWPLARRRPGLAMACAVLAAAMLANGPWRLWSRALLLAPTDPADLARIAAIGEATSPDATIAVVSAGRLPYLLDRPAIDLLGKNDRRLAHGPVAPPYRTFDAPFVSGHVKWDYAWSIGTLQPDVISELWVDEVGAAPFLGEYEAVTLFGERVYFRRGSSRIRWEQLTPFRGGDTPASRR